MVYFLDLPPVALRLIFRQYEVYDPPLLILSKSTLPHELAAVYTNVQLKGRARMRYFVAAVVHQPGLLEHVQSFGISDHACEDGYWEEADGSLGLHQLSSEGGDYDPSHVVLGIELLEELLPRMPRLHNLTMSVPPFQPLLSPDYLQTFPFLSLEHLSLILKETSPPLPPNGLATLRHLEGIPSLGALALRFERRGEDAVSCLNVEPSTYLPPRSVKVKTIFLDGKVVGDVSTLFAALGSGCLSLTLCVAKLSPSIERDFLLLPGSLGSLTVKQGENCGLHPPPPFLPSRPRIGRALANLVNLSYLELQGDVLSPEGFDALPHLPLLHQLVLDPHLRLSSRHLLAFLDADNPLHLAYLGHLNVSVCLCGSAPSGPPKLTWPPSFSAHDARLLVEKANEIGMDIRGSLVWAVCHPLPKPEPKNGVVGRKLLRKAR